MIDIEALRQAFVALYHSGVSQQQIARESGVAQSYIANLISGKRSFDGLTLRKVQKLFPDATISLTGDTVSIHADRNSGNVVGVNHGSVSQDCLSAIQNKILETDDLTAEEKVKVLRVLRG